MTARENWFSTAFSSTFAAIKISLLCFCFQTFVYVWKSVIQGQELFYTFLIRSKHKQSSSDFISNILLNHSNCGILVSWDIKIILRATCSFIYRLQNETVEWKSLRGTNEGDKRLKLFESSSTCLFIKLWCCKYTLLGFDRLEVRWAYFLWIAYFIILISRCFKSVSALVMNEGKIPESELTECSLMFELCFAFKVQRIHWLIHHVNPIDLLIIGAFSSTVFNWVDNAKFTWKFDFISVVKCSRK